MAMTENNVFFNMCKGCKESTQTCGPIYCYSCGDYYASCKRHTCDPKRVLSHEAAMEAASKRGENPNIRTPSYTQQLSDGFDLINANEGD